MSEFCYRWTETDRHRMTDWNRVTESNRVSVGEVCMKIISLLYLKSIFNLSVLSFSVVSLTHMHTHMHYSNECRQWCSDYQSCFTARRFLVWVQVWSHLVTLHWMLNVWMSFFDNQSDKENFWREVSAVSRSFKSSMCLLTRVWNKDSQWPQLQNTFWASQLKCSLSTCPTISNAGKLKRSVWFKSLSKSKTILSWQLRRSIKKICHSQSYTCQKYFFIERVLTCVSIRHSYSYLPSPSPCSDSIHTTHT